MKRYFPILLISGLIITIIILVAINFTYPYEKHISSKIQAIEYRLPDSSTSYDEMRPITVEFDGILRVSMLKKITYDGIILITGISQEVDKSSERQVHMRFYKSGKNFLSYVMDHASMADGSMYNNFFGKTFVDSEFSKVTIERWDSGSHYLISGPANTRESAVNVSNEIMHQFLKEFNRNASYYVVK